MNIVSTDLRNSNGIGLTHHAPELKIFNSPQSKNRLQRNPLYFVMNIVGTGNREGKFE